LPGEEGSEMRQGLAFLAALSFVASFLSIRLFTTLFPGVVVVGGGIHFHHFWYGIVLISVSGWLAISYRNHRLDRVLAILYGAGLGMVGDEVGLLLTLGDYRSLLTYDFFLGAVSFIFLALLLWRYRSHLVDDVIGLTMKERLVHLGVFVVALSGVFLFLGNWTVAALSLAAGGAILLASGWAEGGGRRRKGP
jgi:hypothetical protein